MALTEQEILHKVRCFLHSDTTYGEDVEQLVRYLDWRPEIAATADTPLAIDDVEERLVFASKVIRAMDKCTPAGGPHKLSRFDLSVIFVLPLSELRSLGQGLNGELSSAFDSFTDRAIALVQVLDRDKSEVNKCLERDRSRCVVTGTLNPDVCHVFPFAANNSDTRRSFLERRTLLKTLAGNDTSLFIGQAGSSDRAWNMICLNRQLHSWWGRGFFALQCLGVVPELGGSSGGRPRSIVKLKFHWLPLQKRGQSQGAVGESHTDFISHHEEWLRNWQQRPHYGSVDRDNHNVNAAVAAPHVATSRLVRTGHVFQLTMPSVEDGMRMKAVFDVQWACILMASMSGAAGDPDFLFHRRYDFGRDPAGLVAVSEELKRDGLLDFDCDVASLVTADYGELHQAISTQQQERQAESGEKASRSADAAQRIRSAKGKAAEAPASPPLPKQQPKEKLSEQDLRNKLLNPLVDMGEGSSTAIKDKAPTNIRTLTKALGKKIRLALKADTKSVAKNL